MKGFRSFLLRGNVVDLAVGIVIGAAFTAVVNGFVTAFLTPIVGLITNSTGDYSKKSYTVSGVAFPYGALVSALMLLPLFAGLLPTTLKNDINPFLPSVAGGSALRALRTTPLRLLPPSPFPLAVAGSSFAAAAAGSSFHKS